MTKNFLLIISIFFHSSAHSMASMKKLAGLASTATVACAAALYTDQHLPYVSAEQAQRINTWIKPKWALKNNLPNGVPQTVNDLVDFLDNPKKYTDLGAEMPKGVLLYGPPGTGKTSIGRAIAETTNRTFLYTAGSELTAHLHGLGPDRVRDVFAKARKEKKSVVFIDEIDVIAQTRGSRFSGNDEQLSQLLHELDGFKQDENIFVIAATNVKDSIDSALLRPGRLGHHILIPLPDAQGREDIIRHYIGKITYQGKDVASFVASQTEGYSGADLKYLINDAAILAGRHNAKVVTETHILDTLKSRTLNRKVTQ